MVDHEQLWVPNSNVVPGDHASSLMWQKVNGGMGNLSTTDIDKIQNWIDNLKRTVTVLPSNGGTVTPGGTLPIGSSRNITALPNPGWRFDHWTDDNNNTNTANPLPITVPWCDITYTASFVQGPPPPPPPPGAGTAIVADFNGDGHPDWVIRNPATGQTAIWYLNNNALISGVLGPTLPAGWGLRGAADFNSDSHPDYGLFSGARQTAIWYLSGPTFIGGVFGPTPPSGWALVATADFNRFDFLCWFFGLCYPDYVLYNPTTRQTAIWYLNNNVLVGGAYGPTLPPGWELVATADFNGDGNPDYLLYAPTTRQTAIWYMNNNVFVSGAYGPTLPAGWSLVGP